MSDVCKLAEQSAILYQLQIGLILVIRCLLEEVHL